MGLFKKEICFLCGGKAGLLTREKLSDGTYICGDCTGKCSRSLTGDDYHAMSQDEIREHIAYMDENRAIYESEFRANYVIHGGVMGGKDMLLVDEKNGLWCTPDHEVFQFAQVRGWELILDTNRMSEEKRRERGHHFPIMPPVVGMPIPSPDEEISRMKIRVRLDDHPWLQTTYINVMDAIFVTDADIRAGYDTAAQIYDLFDRWYNRAPVQTVIQNVQHVQTSAADEIMKFKQLLDMGVITKEEFDAKKKQLLGL